MEEIAQIEALRRLQAITQALGSATTAQEVAQLALRDGAAFLGASAGSLAILQGDELRILASVGDDPALERFARSPIATSPAPMAMALREGRALFVPDRDGYRATFPGQPPLAAVEALLAAPLACEGRALGAIGLWFS